MKKCIAFLLTLVMVLAMTSIAFANPGQNPNRNPGSPEVTVDNIRITVTGGGNNLVIRAYDLLNGGSIVVPRAGNGTFTQTVSAFGYEVFIRVQGNSLREATVVSRPTPPPPAPYVVEEYDFYRFVRLNQVESYFAGTEEVSREFVNGSAALHNWVRTNNIPGVNGQAVVTGVRVTGTLNYTFVRNYVEQFERVYEWVDVTVWSNGDRDEVVREDSEHVRGDLVDGEEYYTGPYAGSRAIDVASTDTVTVHMGYQGGVYARYATLTAGNFTVDITLHNTGNPPSATVIIAGVDLAAL